MDNIALHVFHDPYMVGMTVLPPIEKYQIAGSGNVAGFLP
jgi:hypothetical protein